MKTYQRLAVAVLLALVAAACGGDSPTSPSSTSVAGTWQGTFTSNNFSGNGTAQVTLAQNGGSVSGTWSTNDPTGAASGTVSGSRNGSSVSITLQPSNPTFCQMSVTASVSGTQMTGTWATVQCTGFASGSISMTKQ